MKQLPPECPFCGQYIVVPKVMKAEFGEILGGACKCGAVYVCDPTGRNTGEAYTEALALAKGDWDIDTMNQDADYQTEDMSYDLKRHAKIYSEGHSTTKGKLVFVRLGSTYNHQPAANNTQVSFKKDNFKGNKMKLKEKIKNLLKSKSFEDIANISLHEKGVIKVIISLTYDKDDVISWQAIETMGLIARKWSEERVGVVRDTIRRLLWSMGDESGGIGWGAAEMLGEIIRSDPDNFIDIVPILWSFRDEEMFRAGTVWAMSRIADIKPDLMPFTYKDLQSLLIDKDPAVRGYTAWLIGILREKNLLEDIKKLLSDAVVINFYQDGELTKRTVGDIVKEAINKVNKNIK